MTPIYRPTHQANECAAVAAMLALLAALSAVAGSGQPETNNCRVSLSDSSGIGAAASAECQGPTWELYRFATRTIEVMR